MACDTCCQCGAFRGPTVRHLTDSVTLTLRLTGPYVTHYPNATASPPRGMPR